MSVQGLYIGLTGINSHQRALDVVGNNIANVNTTGYKASRAEFGDLFSSLLHSSREAVAGAASLPAVQQGLGVRITAVSADVRQGQMEETGLPSDLAVVGEGYFIVREADGTPQFYYTRDGSFQIDVNNNDPTRPVEFAPPAYLVTSQGLRVQGYNVTGQIGGINALPMTPTAVADLELDFVTSLAAYATTQIGVTGNLNSGQAVAIAPVIFESDTTGRTNTARFEFAKASVEGNYYYFRATSPTLNPDGTFTTLTDAGDGPNSGNPIEGFLRFDDNGRVIGWFTASADAAGDHFLTEAEITNLQSWPQYNQYLMGDEILGNSTGLDTQTFTTSGLPVLRGSENVYVDGVPYSRVSAFTAGGANQYMFDPATGTVTFGSAAAGGVPPLGSEITINYATENASIVLAGTAQIKGGETLGASAGQDNELYHLGRPPVPGNSVRVTVGGVEYRRVTEFTTGGTGEYMLDATTGEVRFGTSTAGGVPPAGSTIVASYAYNNSNFVIGEAGQVIAGQDPYQADGSTIPPAFKVLDPPIRAGTLTVNNTVGGAAVVEGTDYVVNYATGEITPWTVWDAGTITVSYTNDTTGLPVVNEDPHVADGTSVPTRFYLQNPPVEEGTLTINNTIGGLPLQAGQDYTVNYETGLVSPLTVWDAGGITVNYQEKDTRQTIDFGVRTAVDNEIKFQVRGTNESASAEKLKNDEVIYGFSEPVYDSADQTHQLRFTYEHISENKWLWKATPRVYENYGADSLFHPGGGGGTASDGLRLANGGVLEPQVENPRKYEITITIDEGQGPQTWVQVDPLNGFPNTGPLTNYFYISDPATGEITLSRDISTANVSIKTDYPYNTALGSGILAFDQDGNIDPAYTQTFQSPIVFTPSGAAELSITPNFDNLKQTFKENEVFADVNDGFPEGQYVDYFFDENGIVWGYYDNGMTQALGRIALQRFANPAGLMKAGNNLLQDTVNAGRWSTTSFANSRDDGTGFIRPMNLERSNVDMTTELTQLIIIQRAYQFNSRAATAHDELLRESINLKR